VPLLNVLSGAKMANEERNESRRLAPCQSTDAKLLNAARGLLVLLVPIGGIIGAYYSTRAALEFDIRENRGRLERIEETLKEETVSLKRSIERVRTDLDAHCNLGPDGLPHPQGVIRDVIDLEERVKNLEQKVK